MLPPPRCHLPWPSPASRLSPAAVTLGDTKRAGRREKTSPGAAGGVGHNLISIFFVPRAGAFPSTPRSHRSDKMLLFLTKPGVNTAGRNRTHLLTLGKKAERQQANPVRPTVGSCCLSPPSKGELLITLCHRVTTSDWNNG